MPDDLTPAAASDAGDDAPALPPGDWLNVSQPNTPTAAPDWQAIAAQAVEALRLTREYVSPIIRLAAWPGWSWFDATNTYRRAAGIPTLEPEPVPELLAAGDAPTGYSPDYTSSDRGFKHLEPVPSTYAGRVRVYESSAADGPHLWLAITQPVDLNEPTGPELSTRAHLTAGSAEEVALQLLWLLEHHYQGASGSARATAAIRGLLAGDDSTAQAAPEAAAADNNTVTGTLADADLARMLADYPPPLFTTPPPAGTPRPATAQQIRATHRYGFRAGQWADLIGTTRADIGGKVARELYVVRFPDDGYVDLWAEIDPSDAYEFRTRPAGSEASAGDPVLLAEIARHLEQGDVLTAAGDWAPDTAAGPWYQLGRRLIRRGVRRGRAQAAVYLRILTALNRAEAAGHTGGRSDRPTRTGTSDAATTEAAAE